MASSLERIHQYITRFAPSKIRLQEYITRKWFIISFDELWYDEDIMLHLWIRNYISLAKPIQYTKQKLYQKKFPKESIERIMESYNESFTDWDGYKIRIQSIIDTWVRQGKSIAILRWKLVWLYPIFRDEIDSLLTCNPTSDKENLQTIHIRYQNKYNLTERNGKQKYILFLQRRGFLYKDIVSLLSGDE